MRNRFWLIVLLVCWLAPGWAQEARFGRLVITVQTADGTACAGCPIYVKTVTVNRFGNRGWQNERTGPDGVFRTDVNAGDVIVTARGVAVAANVAGGAAETAVTVIAPKLETRTVTQTVFDAGGKAKPAAAVTASYFHDGKLQLRQAVADAQGGITWDALPTVRVIVWGAGVPASVIPSAGTAFPKPLPAPSGEATYQVRCALQNLPDPPATVQYLFRTSSERNRYPQTEHFNPNPGEAMRCLLHASLVSGETFSVTTMARGATLSRSGNVQDLYAPYFDEACTDEVEFPLALTDNPTAQLKLVTKDGKPVPGVSRLDVVPVNPVDQSSLFTQMRRQMGDSPVDITENGDGTYTVSATAPGVYRVCVDLIDQSTPPTKELQFTLPAPDNAVTLTLPAPITSVPGGTELSWITTTQPQAVRHLTVAAMATSMPVFGPADRVLALWYRPTPDGLTVFNATDGGKAKTLTLRSIRFHLATAADGSTNRSVVDLLPLLPAPRRRFSSGTQQDPQPELNGVSVRENARVNVWPGAWLQNNGAQSKVIDIPAAGPDVVTLTLDSRVIGMGNNTAWRNFRVRLPKGDYEALRKANPNTYPWYDTGMYRNRNDVNMPRKDDDTAYINLSSTLKTFTIVWQGVGIIRDVPVPADDTKVIDLPAWDPGVTINGTVLGSDGKPLPRSDMYLENIDAAQNGSGGQQVRPDAQGAFVLKAIFPGEYTLYNQSGEYPGVWRLTVPAQGVKDITLRVPEKSVRVSLDSLWQNNNSQMGEYQSMGYYGNSPVVRYWFPDGGKPAALYTRNDYNNNAFYDLKPGKGALWVFNTGSGQGVYARTTLTYDENDLRQTPLINSTLALYLPLDFEAGPPGALTLTGQDTLADIHLALPATLWQPSILLHRYVYQVGAVPPGKYAITIDSPRGPVTTDATVGEYGTYQELAFPKKQ